MLTQDEFATNLMQIDADLFGHHFKVPVVYRDASSVTAVFPAKAPALARLLPHPELHLMRLLPGVAPLAITIFEYRDTDIGPYNELAVSIPCLHAEPAVPLWSLARDARRRTMHAYVLQLPVTTEIARVGGVELYGFPKILADIDFSVQAHQFRGELTLDGRRVISLSGPLPATDLEDIPSRYVAYSMRNGRLMEAPIAMRTDALGSRSGGNGMTLTLDETHPIGQQLATVLLRKQPLRVEYASRFRSILHAPDCLE